VLADAFSAGVEARGVIRPIDPTMNGASAAQRRWDALVVGAGPAGSAATIALADAGAAVLLIDKKLFPRPKVCGCCVNAAALRALERLGVQDCVRTLGATPIEALCLSAGGRSAHVAMRGGAAISRAALDAALVERAIKAGAHFIPGAVAGRADCGASERVVHVQRGRESVTIRASVVVAADGLAGRLGASSGGTVSKGSLMGAGIVLGGAPSAYERGVIYMACGRGGYAGVARLERGLVAVSAALDPRCVREAGGPAAMVARLLLQAGLPALRDLDAQHWKGTPLLTRRRRSVASTRFLVAGDATGYVEPFTGEGIVWALASGVAAARIAYRGAQQWSETLTLEWQRTHHQLLGWRRMRCLWLTRALRHPQLTRVAVSLLARMPGLATPIVRGVSNGGFIEPALGR
jgi:flavin-dependent dehydrogenase